MAFQTQLSKQLHTDTSIPSQLYEQYRVKKGLRNADGTGVLIGLTKISDVVGYQMIDGTKQNCDGMLYYRGISVLEMLQEDVNRSNRFEECIYLLLFGSLPNTSQLDAFQASLNKQQDLPPNLSIAHIAANPQGNWMNKLQQIILQLYTFDANADDNSIEHTLQQGLALIAKMPAILACMQPHTKQQQDLTQKSISYRLLALLSSDTSFLDKRAQVLDALLVLHADHGGGNNSTFTNVVLSSTGTDYYSTICSAIGSLKGPSHGGANTCVHEMMLAIQQDIGWDASDEQIKSIAHALLDGTYYDHKGLIYGLGHAVYTLSDPRACALKQLIATLPNMEQYQDQFTFYQRFETIAKQVILERKGIVVASNIDFYSGLAFSMLGFSSILFPLIFVTARMSGWLAHNIENKRFCNKIVRPATKYVGNLYPYTPLKERL
ncbi:MAG: citrate synthase [Erysipelotrichaceae bacterium]